MVHLLGGHLEPSRHTVVGVFRKRVVKGGGTTGVLDQRASEGGKGQRTDRNRGPITQGTDYDSEPITAQGHGPANRENANRKRHR